MAIKESLWFSYAGIKSTDMGITNVNMSTGLQEEFFLPELEIKETTIRGRNTPYFHEVTQKPLVINLEFLFDEEWDEAKIREIARWLNQSYYQELYFSDNINRIFYAIYNGSPTLLHNNLKQGIIQIEMRCKDSFSYSPTYLTTTYNLTTNPVNGTVITFDNLGDVDLLPEIEITKVGSGNVSIINQTNGNKGFTMTGLADAETVYINCHTQHIETDIPLTYRYDNFSGNYLKLKYGVNNLLVTGTCSLQFRYRYATLQG